MSLPTLFRKLSRWPLGKCIFSFVACRRAPYFASISPCITALDANCVIVAVKKRRKVLNHIKTMHAIAMCNASELAAGLLMEAGLPEHLRWIPKQMQVSYLKKAETSIRAVAKVNDWQNVQAGDLPVQVDVLDENDVVVVSAVITMWISEKKF